MTKSVPITVARGDGIGPEIMQATLDIIQAAGAQLDIEEVDIGEKVYLAGHSAGIEDSTWESIRRTKVFLKAPITTPQGGGFKSLNVTVRTTLGLYANVRPCVSYHPFVDTKHPKMDVVIIRENEEDLYTGIEYRQTPNTYQALKIITRPGCERIIRFAFEYALQNGRKKVTCFTKDNILKLSDGLFHQVFDEIAQEYPQLENEHWIIDIGSAKLADTPENFDVVVMPNLYGDILSDVAAQIAGSVGMAGSANIGAHGAMFEAIHGSAPRRAGQNLANPSGLIQGAVLMLIHIGQAKAAEDVRNAWLKTIEDGIHTYDIYKEGVSTQKVGTKEFAQAIIERLGQKPEKLPPVSFGDHAGKEMNLDVGSKVASPKGKDLMGIDVFVQSDLSTQELQNQISTMNNGDLQLTMISNRGARMWPNTAPETNVTDSWRCRFMSTSKGSPINHTQVVQLLGRLAEANVDFTQTEHLYAFDGAPGYSLSADEQ